MNSEQVYLPLTLNSDLARNVLIRSHLESKSVAAIIKNILIEYFECHPAAIAEAEITIPNSIYIEPNLKNKIGERLSYLRKCSCLSQKMLGEIVGLDQRTISRIETGGRKLDVLELLIFSQLFNVELSFFFE